MFLVSEIIAPVASTQYGRFTNCSVLNLFLFPLVVVIWWSYLDIKLQPFYHQRWMELCLSTFTGDISSIQCINRSSTTLTYARHTNFNRMHLHHRIRNCQTLNKLYILLWEEAKIHSNEDITIYHAHIIATIITITIIIIKKCIAMTRSSLKICMLFLLKFQIKTSIKRILFTK